MADPHLPPDPGGTTEQRLQQREEAVTEQKEAFSVDGPASLQSHRRLREAMETMRQEAEAEPKDFYDAKILQEIMTEMEAILQRRQRDRSEARP